MKKFFYSFLTAVVLLLASCQGNGADQVTDYMGDYSFHATGEVALSMGSQSFNYPLDDDGKFTISKVDDEGRVMLTGYNDTIYGTIAGNKLFFESSTMTEDYNGITINFTFIYDTGTFKGNTLSWNTNVQASATGTVMGVPVTATGSGQVLIDATKIAD